MAKLFGIICIFLAIFLAAYVWYVNNKYIDVTRPFSSYTVLSSSWTKYKMKFMNKDGRVIDNSLGDVTTSEGQSYALLRSVWIDDKDTFDLVWKWTKTTMKRPNDHLFGWKWGKRTDGTYGFFENGGENSASDADSDIALALILASRRWDDKTYQTDADNILADLWKVETAQAGGKRYLIAGNWSQDPNRIIINPSYFAPYSWRIFAHVDKKHDWNSLISPAYELLTHVGTAPLDGDKGVGLPPDWVAVDKQTGQLSATHLDKLSTNYSYDAIRVPFRIAIDYQWNHEPKAATYLKNSFTTLHNDYKNTGKLFNAYAHDGQPLTTIESPALYAGVLGAFMVTDPDLAKKLYEEKIMRLYSNDENSFDPSLPYYEQNLVWFASALYNKVIIPFTKK